jgi:hypothetical protein
LTDRRRAHPLRIALGVAIGVVFLYCLLGILVTGPVVVRPGEVAIDAGASPERLRASVAKLCGELSPRSFRHVENLDLAADWIAQEFDRAGLEVELQDYQLRDGRFRNVIGVRRSSRGVAGARVIGAHYDAFREYPGADDNASGVAVLLELVRTLPPQDPRGDQYFVAFSTEEPPFFGSEQMGSHVFAESLVRRGVEVDLMVALDLVGYYSDRPRSQRFPLPGLSWLYPDAGDFVAVVGDLRSGHWLRQVKRQLRSAREIPVHSFRAPESTGVNESDHLSFRRLGLPGVLVTDTAFMRYPHYHTPDDTPEKLDYERMAHLVEALHTLFVDPSASD